MKVPVQLEINHEGEGKLSAHLLKNSTAKLKSNLDGQIEFDSEGFQTLDGTAYILTEHNYQSIKQDFEILIKANPKLESALVAILQAIHCELK